jgi:hypothetical protein
VAKKKGFMDKAQAQISRAAKAAATAAATPAAEAVMQTIMKSFERGNKSVKRKKNTAPRKTASRKKRQ